jgi:hypothetical protein
VTPGELLVIGIAAVLILCVLLGELLHWTLSWRELLTATSAAFLIEITIKGRSDFDLAAMTAVYPGGFAGSSHVCPCVALAFIGILACSTCCRKIS